MAENRSSMFWWILGLLLVIGLPFLLYLSIGGIVEGEEFSPDDFSRRFFTYNVMPIFGVCIQGIDYHDKTPVFEQTLVADGFLGKNLPTADSAKKWHLVYDNASNSESRDFDAMLLTRFLDLVDTEEHESIWDPWNERFPELASRFWPLVADMAKSYIYVELTEIMAQARSLDETRLEEFDAFMVQRASSSFADRADQAKDEGDYQKALNLYKKSHHWLPSDHAAEGKAECREQLGIEESNVVEDAISAEVEDQ